MGTDCFAIDGSTGRIPFRPAVEFTPCPTRYSGGVSYRIRIYGDFFVRGGEPAPPLPPTSGAYNPVAYLVLVLVDLRVRRGAVLAHLELAAETHARVVAVLEALQTHPTAAGPAGRLFGRLRFRPGTKQSRNATVSGRLRWTAEPRGGRGDGARELGFRVRMNMKRRKIVLFFQYIFLRLQL